MSFSDRAAQLVSIVFHPLWIPVGLFALLLAFDPHFSYVIPKAMVRYVVFLLLVNSLALAVSIWLLARGGAVSSVRLPKRKERFLPLLIVLAYYSMTYALIRAVPSGIPALMLSLLLSLVICMAGALIANFYFKISLHALSLGGCAGAVAGIQWAHGLGPALFLVATVMAGSLVCWARLHLRAHNHAQVYSGYFLGFVCTSACLFFGWII